MSVQLAMPLDSPVEPPPPPPPPTTEQRWADWLAKHPDIIALAVDHARSDIARGASRISAKAITERIRPAVAGGIDNRFTPHLARHLIDVAPELAPFITLRKVGNVSH